MYTICPDPPTATPLLASPIETPCMIVVPTFVVVASVQSTPPLVVYTICPDPPTATPLLASLIEIPIMVVVPTFVVVAAVQVSAAYAFDGT